MKHDKTSRTTEVTRREVVKAASLASLATAFAGTGGVFAAHASERIRVGVIGCGGRGTEAALNCATASPDVVITALGDVFPDQLQWSLGQLKQKLATDRLLATPETCFSGFDAYRKVLAADVDLVILAAPPFFRPSHLAAAIEAGKHVFTEKPVAVDPVGVRSVIATSELAARKGLAIVAGTQRRHQAHYLEIMKRVRAGDIGELVAGQCYWNMGSLWVSPGRAELGRPRDQGLVGHGVAAAQLALHQLGLGRPHRRAARPQPRRDELGHGRAPGEVLRHGRPRGAHRADVRQHLGPLRSRVRVPERGPRAQHVPPDRRGDRERQRARGRHERLLLHRQRGRLHQGGAPYENEAASPNPYVQEHVDLVASIKAGKPLNEGRQVAESTLTAIMGRMSAYTGRALNWDWVMNASKLDLTPPHMEWKELPPLEVAVPGKTPLV